jgi:mycothiol system anti-sigma-R factor
MPDCNQTLRELQLFLDGELPGEEYEHVLGHLDECLECFHAFDFHAELKQVIAAKCREQMPPDLLERIQQRLAPEDAASPETAEPT